MKGLPAQLPIKCPPEYVGRFSTDQMDDEDDEDRTRRVRVRRKRPRRRLRK